MMKDNLFLDLSNLDGQNKAIFARWLEEYENDLEVSAAIEKTFAGIDNNDSEEDRKALADFVKHNKHRFTEVRRSQIRMLDLEMTADADVITPVLVLSEWSDNMWLVAPYSRFQTPATSGELKMESDFYAYRTLEVWNAFTISELLLSTESTYLRTVSETDRLDACKVFFHIANQEILPKELEARLGAPIMSDLDPRIQYILSEQEQVKPSILKTMVFLDKLGELVAEKSCDEEYALAAGEEKNDLYMELTLDGRTEQITLDFELETRTLRIKVLDSSGEKFSKELDGWCVVDAGGKVLGQIEDGFLLARDVDAAKLPPLLADMDNNLLPLRRNEVC